MTAQRGLRGFDLRVGCRLDGNFAACAPKPLSEVFAAFSALYPAALAIAAQESLRASLTGHEMLHLFLERCVRCKQRLQARDSSLVRVCAESATA